MGKKGKNKQKVSGTVKTALKTEKKLNAKQKKELAALGEVSFQIVYCLFWFLGMRFRNFWRVLERVRGFEKF